MIQKQLKRILSVLALVTVFTVGYGVSFYYGYIPENQFVNSAIDAALPYPEQTGQKEVVLDCDYHGSKVEIKETLYKSSYEYYQNKPNKFANYYGGWNKGFIYNAKEDLVLDDLAAKIKAEGQAKSLDNDQILDLATCLLQSIPYDDAKAQKILGSNPSQFPVKELMPRYPYETLYDGIGICTDKTYLGIAIFERLGYRTAVLEFDKERHMSIGVGVPSGDGNFDLNYGIVELTNTGFRVGDAPELKSGAGSTINNYQTIPTITEENTPQSVAKLTLTTPSAVEPISGGADYLLIAKRIAIKTQIDAEILGIEADLVGVKNAETQLAAQEAALAAAEAKYKKEGTMSSYSAYTATYNQYLSSYNLAKNLVGKYNIRVNSYNKLLLDYLSI